MSFDVLFRKDRHDPLIFLSRRDPDTTGLHMSDITHLIEFMNRLVEGGNTVIVIEYNLNVISSADWIIDMGPEGFNKGGQIIFEGTPKHLLGAKQSLTSKYLKQ
jgi:excinuclease UvrABC ATPase subunit